MIDTVQTTALTDLFGITDRTIRDISKRRILMRGGRDFATLFEASLKAKRVERGDRQAKERMLNDGSVFRIFKRYFDRDDISRWQDRQGVRVRVEYFGAGLLAVSGAFGAVATNDSDR